MRHIKTGLLATVLVMPTGAFAQSGTQVPSASRPGAEAGQDEIIVTGFRRSLDEAIRIKREQDGITDSISSDGIDRFPDLNLGEALQRIPGIQLNREAESRNATINLRGMPGSYTLTTINGAGLASPTLSGSSPLGAFISDIFSGVTVKKSPAASDRAGGLSGIIDMKVDGALGRRPGATMRVGLEHNRLGSRTTPSFYGNYNGRITDDIAAYATIAYRKESFRRDSVSSPVYGQLGTASRTNYLDYYAPTGGCAGLPSTAGCVAFAGGTGRLSNRGLFFPSDVRQTVAFNNGRTISGAAGIETRITPNLRLGISGFFTDRDMVNSVEMFGIQSGGNSVNVQPTSDIFLSPEGVHYFNKYNFANATHLVSFRPQPFVQRTFSISKEVNWTPERWKIRALATGSRATNIGNQVFYEFRNTSRFVNRANPNATNGITGSIDIGNGNIRDYSAIINAPGPLIPIVPGTVYTPANGNASNLVSPSGDVIAIAGQDNKVVSSLLSGQVDFDREVALGPLRNIIFGAMWEKNTFSSVGLGVSNIGVRNNAFTQDSVVESSFLNDFFGGKAPGFSRSWLITNHDLVTSQLQPVTVPAGAQTTSTGFVVDRTSSTFLRNNFDNDNSIWAAYLMGRVDTPVFDIPVRGNFGVRYEATDNRISALDRARGNNFVRNEYRQKYGEWLPSFMFAASPSRNVLVRVAGYDTYVRPQPRDAVPTTSVTETSSGFTVNLGSNNLRPYKARSFDVAFEWYNRPGGFFGLSLYTKRVVNLIGPERDASRLCPADGTAIGIGNAAYQGTVCYSDILLPGGTPAIVSASGRRNEPNPLTVRGLEFTTKQDFSMIAAALKGFGTQISYSFVDFDGKNADGSDAMLNGVSRHNVNLIGYYETKLFGVRLAYNWRNKYQVLSTDAFFGLTPRFVKERGQLDLSASMRLTKRVSLVADVFNITDSRRMEYQSLERLPRSNEYDGRTVRAGLRWTK